jgi:2-methylcitrate dehydratase PrpD
LADEDIRALAERVRMKVDPGAEAAYPQQRCARVSVLTWDGRRFEHLRTTRKGDPDDPLSDAELQEKFVELVLPVLGPRSADKLLAAVWELPKLSDVRSLTWHGEERR